MMTPIFILCIGAVAAAVKPSDVPRPEASQGSCPDGWVESSTIEDRCFRFEKVEQTWWDAKNLCELAHGQLLNIRNSNEKAWIQGQVQRLGHESSHWFGFYNEPARPSWWTGLKKLDGHVVHVEYKNGKMTYLWTWADESEVDKLLINWQSGKPTHSDNTNCGELHIDGFKDNLCSTKFPFICAKPKDSRSVNTCDFGENMVWGSCVKYETGQTPSTTTTSTTTAVPSHVPVQGVCPEGWEESSVINNRCYRFEKEKMLDWDQAEKMCQSARGELVSLRDEIEKNWVQSVIIGMKKNQWSYQKWWTGLNRLGPNHLWRWSDGNLTNDTNIPWQLNEPNNEMEQCGEMHTTGMNDNGCWKRANFICARDKNLYREVIECPFGQVLMGRMCENFQFQTPVPSPAGICPEGWIEGVVTPETCYRFVTSTETHENAKLMCRAANADLWVAKSTEEQIWLEKQVHSQSHANGKWEFYIGLSKVDNAWQWLDGSVIDDPSSFLKGSNVLGTCATILPAGIQRDQCWGSKAYICSRPADLGPGSHECTWGQQWADGRCNQYTPNNYRTRVAVVEGLDVKRLEDSLQRMRGKHGREMLAMKHAIKTQLGELVERIQVLEGALGMRDQPTPTSRDAAILDFNPSLTLVISNLPTDETEDPTQIVTRFLSNVLQLSDIHVVQARGQGGRGSNIPKIKVMLADQESKQAIMGARKQVNEIPGYENVRIVAAPMRLRPKKE